jgi:hypothetical protein
MESGKTDEARTLLDQLFKQSIVQFDDSSFNLLKSKRMLVATTLEEFLTHAPRVAAAISWNDDGREIPADDETVSTEMKDIKGQSRFDYDAAIAFNQRIPLSLLKTAAKSTMLPEILRRDLAQAVWLRAVILGDTKTADELTPVVSSLIPELSPFLNAYLSAATPQAKKSSAIYAWLKFPGLEPVVDLGIGRADRMFVSYVFRGFGWMMDVREQLQQPIVRPVIPPDPGIVPPMAAEGVIPEIIGTVHDRLAGSNAFAPATRSAR